MLAGMIAAAALDDSDEGGLQVSQPSEPEVVTADVVHHWRLLDNTDSGSGNKPWPSGGVYVSTGGDHWWTSPSPPHHDFTLQLNVSCPFGWIFEFEFKRTVTLNNSIMRIQFSDPASNFTHDIGSDGSSALGPHHHAAPMLRFNMGLTPAGAHSSNSYLTLYEYPVGGGTDPTPEWTSPGFPGLVNQDQWYHHALIHDPITKTLEWFVDGNQKFTQPTAGAYGNFNGIVLAAIPHADFKNVKLTSIPESFTYNSGASSSASTTPESLQVGLGAWWEHFSDYHHWFGPGAQGTGGHLP